MPIFTTGDALLYFISLNFFIYALSHGITSNWVRSYHCIGSRELAELMNTSGLSSLVMVCISIGTSVWVAGWGTSLSKPTLSDNAIIRMKFLNLSNCLVACIKKAISYCRQGPPVHRKDRTTAGKQSPGHQCMNLNAEPHDSAQVHRHLPTSQQGLS